MGTARFFTSSCSFRKPTGKTRSHLLHSFSQLGVDSRKTRDPSLDPPSPFAPCKSLYGLCTWAVPCVPAECAATASLPQLLLLLPVRHAQLPLTRLQRRQLHLYQVGQEKDEEEEEEEEEAREKRILEQVPRPL